MTAVTLGHSRDFRFLASMVLLLAFIFAPASTATAQEVMYADTWNDEPEENLDLPLYGIGVTEEWGGYSPEKVETTRYGDSGETLDYAESPVNYFYVEAMVSHWLPWGPIPPIVIAPMNCAVVIHLRFLLDDGFETIGESLSQLIPRKFLGRYKYQRQLSDGSYEYIRSTAFCDGVCQSPRRCHAVQADWLKQQGWYLTRFGTTACLGTVLPAWSEPPVTSRSEPTPAATQAAM
jgi:hypothetical protein